MTALIEIRDISKVYRMGDVDVRALNKVSLSINEGEFVAIMGHSGSGKSTMMHILGLLDRPGSGSYLLRGREVSTLTEDELAHERSRYIGFIFQQFYLLPRTSALENVRLPLMYSSEPVDKQRPRLLLEEVGLGHRLHHTPNELSGGQQQRVAIARALIHDPDILLADEPTGNLDSKSAQEIMLLLSEFNQLGKTIILVTHEPELAQYAKRIVTLRDGLIISDTQNTPPTIPPEQAGASSDSSPNHRAILLNAIPESHLHKEATFYSRAVTVGRRFAGVVRQAIRTVRSNKVRSGLSMLGILIGVAAVIAMLAIGTGAKEAIRQQLSSLGSNVLLLMPGAHQARGVSQQAGAVTRLTPEDANALVRQIPAIKRMTPSIHGRCQIVYHSSNWNSQVFGAAPDYAEMRAAVPQVGRFFNKNEMTTRARVAVIGITPWRKLFGNANPIGETIKINRINFQVIGVLPEKGGNQWQDQDDVIVIPLTTAMYRLMGRRYVDNISFEIRDASEVTDTQKEILEKIMQRHKLSLADDADAFMVRNLSEIQDAIAATGRTMSLLLSSIAIISLLVGGIGIMNIMLVSVTERIQEIGLRKAIGARRREILLQFLTEASVISTTGGLVGIAIGWASAFALAQIAGWAAILSWPAVGLAFFFSALVGIVFGLWPARRAALLNPIDALRHE